MKDNIVLLYTKVPQIGNTKTRIAKESNEFFALMVGLCSLRDTINKVSRSSHYDFIVVVNNEQEAKLFKDKLGLNTYVLDETILQKDQSGRFSFLFTFFKKSYRNVILIPSDVPAITESTLTEAFGKLNTQKYVFGPEFNGGVYLIGLGTLPNKVFENVRWSTPYSVKDLIKNSSGSYLLELQGDLNTLGDLKVFKESIRQHSPLLYDRLMKIKFYEEKIYAYH